MPRSPTVRLVPLACLLLAAWPARGAEPEARTFDLSYAVTVRRVPDGVKVLEAWLPVPPTDANQTIHRLTIDAPGRVTITREPRLGNRALYVRVEHPAATVPIRLDIRATRREDDGHAETLGPDEASALRAPEPLVPTDGPVKALADEATLGARTDAEKARAIYDAVTRLMTYDKSGTGWGRGDALFACDARRGNCTDFHALLIGMARSQGLPARFAIGLSLPSARGSGTVAGYHCWAEMYVGGRGWVPVDASEAAKDPSKHDYYFGHHDPDRIELSRGRHLVLDPAPKAGPINFFVEPHVELDGRTHADVGRVATFNDLPANPGGRGSL